MSYKIVITKIEKDVPYTSKEWKKLRDEENADPTGQNELYGYVTTDAVKTVETDVFEQQVEDLDMQKVVAVINNITVKES